ncbi:ParB/RepB/Spo0J family partition protein [Fictibacillus solisalsi]|uniref:ParB/RepB/Spo0J family partition protein n=1 Tax=Fictibacillus solisalsi TaxID=459525 RepID=UPI000B7E1D7C|nr:ParB/RepB/Spo0J family partition protein [Fictibacillus solisalsi]
MAKGLGKGINAFFPGADFENEDTVSEIKLTELRPNPYQPRKVFNESAIAELTESIKEHGVLQPIIARKSIKGYEIVVGERRFRAAKEAGLEQMPVIVKEFTEQKMMEIALIENLQREDLNPIEEAQAYQKLMEHLKITQEELASRVGKSRPHIANFVRLLQLPDPVQEMMSQGELSMGHGRALLGLKKKAKMQAVVEKCVNEKLNVRQLEKLIQQVNLNVPRETKKKSEDKSVFIIEKESTLRDHFGTSVSIKRTKRKGKIEIEFFSDEDLERILDLIGKQ